MKRIPVAGPSITQREIDYVTDAVTRAWYEDANVYHERFERAFAGYLGVEHAMALPSCTSALHLALLALGVGPGDEVIVPELTWIATAAPVTYVGATPVFADVDFRTWCLSAESFRRCLSPRTRAVIPVDLYGGMPDWDAVRAVAAAHHVPVIEDAAEAVGAEHRGRRAGSLGDVGVFSFHGSKTLTTGEGGLLATRDPALYRRAAVLRDHGRQPGDKAFWNAEVAHKYKMSSLQAALGLAQLERVDELVEKKRQLFTWYRERLSGVAGVTLNAEPAETRNAYWMVTAVLDPALGIGKDALLERLSAAGIDGRPFFHPLSAIPAFASLGGPAAWQTRNPVAYAIAATGVNLPSALSLTEEDVERVCGELRRILGA
jgi:perosamine synthetase